ncbi:S41 family peptidase [Sinomicrobium weinanense]|uniref:PDZ domain-containing protein n=1 Tax=Sinomicrobium weinanense TaxID=2842200 RepID=A0A926JP17_9FLAO|nr:S41 family peptidase [Sinomicrobium weinanense]MBC9794850.1 PDZ domain-containing protein [Sinomicrobium weinanense]MBU3125621.1 PDZ domain-containing protein [Sinomicrobium weinanense]
MKNEKNIWLPILLATALAAGVLIGGSLNFDDTPRKFFSSNSKKEKLNRLVDYIEHDYVDEVNTDSIVDITVNKILEKLDPHSVYISREDRQQVSENMQGDFVGIGVSFRMYNDTLSVIRPIQGGPGIKAGIRSGDRILFADNDTLFGKHLRSRDLVDKLKGTAGTPVALKVYRKEEDTLLTLTVKRAKVPIQSVDAFYMLTDRLGYVKINRFAETTYTEFKKALDTLMRRGATQLVLDLRDNPGGYMGVAEEIADEFLERDKLILFTKNKRGEVRKAFATARGDFEDGKVFVLIDEKSASASEIVAGALQDNDKGVIVGRRSFGKGLVQREMALGDGSSVRLTVSRYYTPTGRSIQRSYDKGIDDYYHQFYERYHNGELVTADSIHVNDSLKFTTPKGRVVYGGGGIVPDVFIPLNTSLEEEALNYVLENGFLSYFAFEYLDKNRSLYSGYNEDEFVETVDIGDDLIEEFIKYGKRNRAIVGVDFSRIDFSPYEDSLKKYIKATIAEQLYGPDAYTRIVNTGDHAISKVIELSRNDNDGAEVDNSNAEKLEIKKD